MPQRIIKPGELVIPRNLDEVKDKFIIKDFMDKLYLIGTWNGVTSVFMPHSPDNYSRAMVLAFGRPVKNEDELKQFKAMALDLRQHAQIYENFYAAHNRSVKLLSDPLKDRLS